MNFADKGAPSLLVLSVPDELACNGSSVRCFAVPILSRRGGLLLNIPRGVVSEDALIDSLHVVDESHLLGPSKGVSAHLCEEDEEGNIVLRQESVNSLVIDFSDDVLPLLHEYGVVGVEEGEIVPFSENFPTALPSYTEVCEAATAWIGQSGPERVNFYSAQEDPEEPVVGKAVADAKTSPSKKAPAVKRVTNAQVLDQLSILVAQVKTLSARQDALESQPAKDASGLQGGNIAGVPAVSAGMVEQQAPMQAFAKYAKLVGPPPKVRAASSKDPPVVQMQESPVIPQPAEEGDLVSAINQQSTAMLALVSEIAGGSDPLTDLTSPGQFSTTTRGVQKREKMQSDLATGSSTYYMQMMQQLHKKLFPSRPLPRSEGELAHLSFLEYLEKTGGYRSARESGLLMWLIGHVVDALAVEDLHMARERIALLVIALEQSVVDKGDWSIAFLLSCIGASSPNVSGEVKCDEPLRATFCRPGTSELGSNSSGLRERVGGPIEQEGRPDCAKEEENPGHRRGLPETARATQISEETKGRASCSVPCVEAEYHEEIHCPEDAINGHSHFLDNGLHDRGKDVPADPFSKTFSVHRWCSNLVTSVFRSRTSFASFVRFAIHLPRDSRVSSSPVFPIPLPFVGAFDRMPSGLSKRHCVKIHLRRAVVVVILALNFWWSGNRFVSADLLRRSLSPSQKKIVTRVIDFIQVDGPMIPFPVVSAGRRFPQLIARLSELSSALTDLGVQGSTYSHVFEGRASEVEVKNEVRDELVPYRSLDADRLKLVGTGSWNPIPFLDDDLCVAFTNPDALLYSCDYSGVALPLLSDSPEEVMKLCLKWDDLDLLYLHSLDVPSLFPEQCVKIFNCYKDKKQDRQIGDRRGRNHSEAAVCGPSKSLPSGSDLTEIFFDAESQRLHLSITDRKDFYHQFRVTPTRAQSNTLHCSLPVAQLRDTKAYAAFVDRLSKKSGGRTSLGDDLLQHSRFPTPQRKVPEVLFPSFRSILQGDHGGVEYACQAHAGLLGSYGLLAPKNRLVANRPFRGSHLLEGLVIDDYFSIGISEKTDPSSPDTECFDTAQKAYGDHSLVGSPLKDIRGASQGRVIGAAINAGDEALAKGICTLGSPPEKRYGLAWVTLQLCMLSHTTDVLHLCLLGGWVACLAYRRPMMSILSESFKLVDASRVDSSHPRLVPLPRVVAGELVLLAVLCPLLCSDLCASTKVFATDASLHTGGFCSTQVSSEFAKFLWKVTRSKGAYSRLLSPVECISKRLGLLEELPGSENPSPSRPLAFHYDFLEVFSGAAKVSSCLAKLGFTVGPPVDLSTSLEFNMEFLHIISWLTYMVSSGQVAAFMVEPPCTTFSIMRKPPLRSREKPFGHNPLENQTKNGNLLAQRALQLMAVGEKNLVAGLLEKPLSSMMSYLPSYKSLLAKPTCASCRTDSCMFGSIHLKAFRFVSVHLDLAPLSVRCDKSHTHVPIAGSYTKASATYVDGLAERLASVLSAGIKRHHMIVSDMNDGKGKGLESQVVNSLALCAEWEAESSWTFKKSSHINILEMAVLGRLAKSLGSLGTPLRVVSLADSFVVAAAVSKGRTSSLGLGPVLRRYNATCVAAGLYFNIPFVPTRLNPPDDLTRDVPLRSPAGSFDVRNWPLDSLYDLAELPKTRRWISNWVRLLLSLCGPSLLNLSNRSVFRRSHLGLWTLPDAFLPLPMDFDSTLGFPGEGPVPYLQPVTILLGLFSHCCSAEPGVLGVVVFAMAPFPADAMFPRNAADLTRQASRQNRPELQPGRPVLPTTTLNRDKLFNVFAEWCYGDGIDVYGLLEHSVQNLEEINVLLVKFGKLLYASGRPYGHYSETINAVVSKKAILRRQLQMAWDFAFAWMKAEPPIHHTACPWQILLSLIATALLWGWTREAGALALTWGGLLRAGELTAAYRRDLLLPFDTDFTNKFALLAIAEPKTRFTVARHQSAKVDAPDLLRVVDLAFRKLQPHEKLWPFSPQTLRNRFKTLLAGLSLDGPAVAHHRALDLGSLRPGGATWLLQCTEQAELVRRRGRWISAKVMEVYLQEVGTAQFMNALSREQRSKVFGMAQGFNFILQKAEHFHAAGVPSLVWYKMFCNL